MTCPRVTSYFLDEGGTNYTFVLEDGVILTAPLTLMQGCSSPAEFQAKMEAIYYARNDARTPAKPLPSEVPDPEPTGAGPDSSDQDNSGKSGEIDTGLTAYSGQVH